MSKKFPQKGLWFEDVPEPQISDNDVKIHKTAICGTDLHIYNRDEWSQKTIGIKYTVNTAKTDLKSFMDEIGMKEGFDVGLEKSAMLQGGLDISNIITHRLDITE